MFQRITLVVMSALLVVLPLQAQTQDADAAIRKDYEALEKAQSAMNGEMEDELRQQLMDSYRQTVDGFLGRWEPRSAELERGLFDLARACLQAFAPERATGHLERFLKRNPKADEVPEATMFLGDAYRATGRSEDAIRLYEGFLKSHKSHKLAPHARLGLATARFLSLDFENAAADYRKLLKDHPESEVSADASLQLLNALVYGDQPDAARELLRKLLEEEPEAPELAQRAEQFELLGKTAPTLEGILDWSGVPGSTLERMRGRVVVLAFFRTKHIPCARSLQMLSKLERDLRSQGVTVWGLSKAYKLGKGGWKLDDEMRWLSRYRRSPAPVIQREVGYEPGDDPEELEVWKPLENPIGASLGLTKDFANHRAYKVRRVPTVVVIDKQGVVRLIEEGGQPEGGFQERMLRAVVKRLTGER